MANKYHSLIKKYILDSEISLSRIERELRKKGFNKNKAFLSNLQNGKIDPPSSDISFALAEITGGDTFRLISTALIDQIPTRLTNNNNQLLDLFEQLKSLLSVMMDNNKEIVVDFLTLVLNFNIDRDELLEYLNYDSIKQGLDQVTLNELFQGILPSNANETKTIDTSYTYLPHDLSNDETKYLIECLEVYRKLQLKPVPPT
jgi:hypothetical protein